jgi:hypothetical protein
MFYLPIMIRYDAHYLAEALKIICANHFDTYHLFAGKK